jgi:hypothetical protein
MKNDPKEKPGIEPLPKAPEVPVLPETEPIQIPPEREPIPEPDVSPDPGSE